MAQLEGVFLANVILYFSSVDSVINFKLINKKCDEATKMIRFCKPLYQNDKSGYPQKHIPSNLFDIFPNVETVECYFYGFQKEEMKVISEVKRIRATIFGLTHKINSEIENKIVYIHFIDSRTTQTSFNICLTKYPYLQSARIDWVNENLTKCLGDESLNIKQLIIKTRNDKQLDILKEYKNIKNITVILSEKISKERFLYLNSFLNIKFNQFISEFDLKNCIVPLSDIRLNGKVDVNEVYKLFVFKKCKVIGNVDLRNCEFLECIECSHNRKAKVKVEGLTKLRELINVNNIDTIPSSVTRIYFDNHLPLKQIILKEQIKNGEEYNCCSGILNASYQCNDTNSFQPRVLMNLINCKTLTIRIRSENQIFKLPLSLVELSISGSLGLKQIDEISKLVQLNTLSISFDIFQQKMTETMNNVFKQLVNLKSLKIPHLTNEIKIPQHLFCLEATIYSPLNIKDKMNLKEINLNSSYFEKGIFEVTLPTNLIKLKVDAKIKILNSDEIIIGGSSYSESIQHHPTFYPTF